jgi:hypothetical protein
MPGHYPILASLLLTLAVAYAATAAKSFIAGQRVLNELRARFPDEYASNGRPTYLSFAPFGENYWRPISARNFFTHRRYAELPDTAFIERAERVRAWQTRSEYLMWLTCGMGLLIAFALDR